MNLAFLLLHLTIIHYLPREYIKCLLDRFHPLLENKLGGWSASISATNITTSVIDFASWPLQFPGFQRFHGLSLLWDLC